MQTRTTTQLSGQTQIMKTFPPFEKPYCRTTTKRDFMLNSKLRIYRRAPDIYTNEMGANTILFFGARPRLLSHENTTQVTRNDERLRAFRENLYGLLFCFTQSSIPCVTSRLTQSPSSTTPLKNRGGVRWKILLKKRKKRNKKKIWKRISIIDVGKKKRRNRKMFTGDQFPN